jgi:WD40 repeat protein
VESGKQIGVLIGHASHESAPLSPDVRSASFSPDGRRVVTTFDDNTAQLWDAESAKQIGVLSGHANSVNSAAFSPDGQRVVTASSDDTARLWDTRSTKNLVDDAKRIVPRCLTAARRAAAFLEAEPLGWCIEMAKWPYNTSEWKQWLVDARAGKNPPLPNAR